MIRTPFHTISLTNLIPTLHLILYETQSEFSEIHSNSLFNRTIRSAIQSIQNEMNHLPQIVHFGIVTRGMSETYPIYSIGPEIQNMGHILSPFSKTVHLFGNLMGCVHILETVLQHN